MGHVPRSLLPVCNLFITRGGTINCEITGPRRYSADLPQGGLELPCKLLFSGSSKDITKVENLLKKAPSTVFSENACAHVTSAHNTSDLADNCPAKSCAKALIQQSSVQSIPSAIDVKSSNSTATSNSLDINRFTSFSQGRRKHFKTSPAKRHDLWV